MKANYPLVFYSVMLNGNLDAADAFMTEARKLGISILTPHVNVSDLNFVVEGDKGIRAGFNSIKGVGPKAVTSIMTNREFTSMEDYFDKNDRASLNKAVVQALIKVGAFDGVGICISSEDINIENVDKFVVKTQNDQEYVFLDREQMYKWYELVLEEQTKKATKNYFVPFEMIKGKYFEKFNLIEEKGEAVVVVPEDRLKDIGIKFNDLPNKEVTRKKSRGSFDKSLDPFKNMSVYRKVFILNNAEIANQKSTYLDLYLKESEELGFSFLQHPLEKHINKINSYEDVEDGQPMVTAGIITEIITRKTSKGKSFYWVMIKSPKDVVRVTFWQNQMDMYKDNIKKNNLILVRGIKGYGGINVELVKNLKAEI